MQICQKALKKVFTKERRCECESIEPQKRCPKKQCNGDVGAGLPQELPHSSSSQTHWEWEIRPAVRDVPHYS